jgi:hypothetical protein
MERKNEEGTLKSKTKYIGERDNVQRRKEFQRRIEWDKVKKHARSSKHHSSRSDEIGYVEDLAAALFLRAKVLPNIHTPRVDHVLWSVITRFQRKLLPPIPVSMKNR